MDFEKKRLIWTIVVFITIPIWFIPVTIKLIIGDAWNAVSDWVERRIR